MIEREIEAESQGGNRGDNCICRCRIGAERVEKETMA